MRRALLVLALAIPASALGQTPADGAILADDATVNIAQCTGAANAVRGADDSMTVGLLWATHLATTATTFNAAGKYRVWASNLQPSVDPANGRPCEVTTLTGTFSHGQVVELDAGSQVPSKQSVDLRDIATAAGFGACTSGSSGTIYLCVQWIDVQNGSAVNGWASGATLTLDLTSPTNAPINVKADPGDGVLHVSCTGNDTDSTSFKARATLGADPPKWSSQGTDCGNLSITGLQNNQTYSVVVFGLNDANNPSPASAAVDGTPIPTDDFFHHYRREGGKEQGGCGGAAGALALLGTLSLLAMRRRKP